MATGSHLSAVKEEEEDDEAPTRGDLNREAFYNSLRKKSVDDINANDVRKMVIRQRWLDIATNISLQLEAAAHRELELHRVDGEVLTRQDLANMSAEGVSYLAASLCTAERFEAIRPPIKGKENLEAFVLTLIQELKTDERRDRERACYLSRQDVETRDRMVSSPEVKYHIGEQIHPDLARAPTLNMYLDHCGSPPELGVLNWREIVRRARRNLILPEPQGGTPRNRMQEKMAERRAEKDPYMKLRVRMKEEQPDDDGNTAASSSSCTYTAPMRAPRPMIRIVTKTEGTPAQGSNLAASEDTLQAAAEEEEADYDPTVPHLTDSSVAPSPRSERSSHWSRASSAADEEETQAPDEDEVPDGIVTEQWIFEKNAAKERRVELMEEGPKETIEEDNTDCNI